MACLTDHEGSEEYGDGTGPNDRVVLFEEVEDHGRRAWQNITGRRHGDERDLRGRCRSRAGRPERLADHPAKGENVAEVGNVAEEQQSIAEKENAFLPKY
jgi:hypothetical protein